ncbi:hypothetical protein AVANS_0730 [Campylobacter sp. RM5004]|uniref:hypothetical protein n=1 Tax=Campylobacter sp. RM5004 TaxID=1660078 RepID=UPI001EFB54FC|nr:hypothetical protein [Campylobacter sp. RM5004]ULO01360.1 hypothetical protein AVANS_0730 [Campylobacter sp. RM5004]
MRKELLIALLSAFDKDKNCLMSFELATEHLSDEELKDGVKKCLVMHAKNTLLPADLIKYALSERIEKARKTLYKASRNLWSNTLMITFSDLVLSALVENYGGLEFFNKQDEEYFFNDWGIKSFSDKYIELASKQAKSLRRYVYNEKNALKNSDEFQPAICYIFYDDGLIKQTKYEDLQLALRSEEEKQRYLQEEQDRKNLAKLFQIKVVV